MNAVFHDATVPLSRLRAAGFKIQPVLGTRTNLISLDNRTVAFWTPNHNGQLGLLTVFDEEIFGRLNAH
jgi:hypothetical protein